MELYESRLMFETHDSGEHLAMMERVVDRIPESMARSCGPSARCFFDRHRELRWPDIALSDRSVRKVHRLPTLKDRISREDAEMGFLAAIQGMLTMSPAKRLTATQLLALPFFLQGDKTRERHD